MALGIMRVAWRGGVMKRQNNVVNGSVIIIWRETLSQRNMAAYPKRNGEMKIMLMKMAWRKRNNGERRHQRRNQWQLGLSISAAARGV